jgi:UPF0755 protein
VTERRKPKSRARRWTGSARVALAILILAALSASAGAWLVLWPYGPSKETFVDITPGSSSTMIGFDLEAAGIVRSRYAFDALRLLKGGKLKAGEYRFDHPAPAAEVYARIARGDVFTIAVTIPEGANIFDIAQRLTQAGLDGGQDFINTQSQNLDLVADLDPNAKSLEGYLFPDTYRFGRKTTPLQMQVAMVKRFREVAGQIGLKQNFHNVVTMASLVERETAIDDERPLIASVFFNRLDKSMPLETDPAVIYGLELEGLWRGDIYASDLKRDTPYNTYLHQGLPPGPVDNPGVKSLRAAINPARTDYLYFVAAGADAQGKSLFSTTLEEHNRNVAGYRQALKRAGGQ